MVRVTLSPTLNPTLTRTRTRTRTQPKASREGAAAQRQPAAGERRRDPARVRGARRERRRPPRPAGVARPSRRPVRLRRVAARGGGGQGGAPPRHGVAARGGGAGAREARDVGRAQPGAQPIRAQAGVRPREKRWGHPATMCIAIGGVTTRCTLARLLASKSHVSYLNRECPHVTSPIAKRFLHFLAGL